MAWDWDFFAVYDDSVLIPVNLTQREMALIVSALNDMRSPSDWTDYATFYDEVEPTLATIDYLLRDDQ